jgi:hypothetical protein
MTVIYYNLPVYQMDPFTLKQALNASITWFLQHELEILTVSLLSWLQMTQL